MILSSHLDLASLPILDRQASFFMLVIRNFRRLVFIVINRIKKKLDGVITRILASVTQKIFFILIVNKSGYM